MRYHQYQYRKQVLLDTHYEIMLYSAISKATLKVHYTDIYKRAVGSAG